MRYLVVSVVLLLFQLPTPGRQDARRIVQGTVSFSSSETVSGATVTATDERTGTSFPTVTDQKGRYRLELPPGRYTITVTLAGFAPHRVTGVTVKQSRDVDVRIPVPAPAHKNGKPGGQKAEPPPPPPPPPPPLPLPREPPPPKAGETTGTAGTAASGTLQWNTWPDAYPGPIYEPVPYFRPDTDYLIVLHFSGLPYVQPGVAAQPASGDVSGWVDDWLTAGQPTATLQVLLLPDTNYFNVVESRVASMDIDLKALRDWKGTRPAVRSPLEEIRRANTLGASRPPFVFGEARLRLHTTSREGVGSIGLSIWSDAGRPLDEITLSYCVSRSADRTPQICSGVSPVQETLKGTDSVRVASEKDAAPDAALHFLEIDKRGVIGVFRDNRCTGADCGFKVWTLGRRGDELRTYLANTVLPAFGPAATRSSLADAGQGLFNVLLPDDDSDRDRSDARRAFERFAEPDLTAVPPRQPARSIFVRTLLSEGPVARPLYIPLGLITLASAPNEFLGFRFRIEAPLERQSYRSDTTCISRWFLAMPPSDPTSVNPLPQARKKFEPLMTAWAPRTQKIFETIPELRTWLKEPTPAEASAAIAILSHHNESTIFFDSNETLIASEVRRRFGEATLLVMDGCSTGAPMAVDLLRQFNERGVAAAITSQVAVRPDLAGDFMATLGAEIDKANAPGDTVADVFFRTLRELAGKTGDGAVAEYGPRVLVFSLLGNGAIRICPPQKEVP